MRFRNFVQSDELLEVLNTPPLSNQDDSCLRDRYLAAHGSLPEQELVPVARPLLSRCLRYYVDAWLKNRRQLLSSQELMIGRYAEQHQPMINTVEGEFQVSICEPVELPVEPGQFYEAVDLEAQRFFTGLINSEWKESLAKCSYASCGRYFLLPQRKKPRVSKYGTFCSRRHQSSTSAIQGTRQRRKQVEHELIAMAAKQLKQMGVATGEWQEDSEEKTKLAGKISAQIKRRPYLATIRKSVQVNWVTRHQRAIERVRCE